MEGTWVWLHLYQEANPFIPPFSFLLYAPFFCGAGVQNQSIAHIKQALYH